MDRIMILLVLLTVHYLADFRLQNNWMALGKSKAWKPLLAHVGVYSLCFVPFGLAFALITFCLHLFTDYITSRWTSSLWFVQGCRTKLEARKQEWIGVRDCEPYYNPTKRHQFFCAIGLDQLIHAWCLGLTWIYLYGGF